MEQSHFTTSLNDLLEEFFEKVHGYCLDRDTSLFETLVSISAAEASIPVGGRCATLAAQVKHVVYYLQVLQEAITNPEPQKADWAEVWRTTASVSEEEWLEIKQSLQYEYATIKQVLVHNVQYTSADQFGMAMAVIAHSAYHLGEIRQALCWLHKGP